MFQVLILICSASLLRSECQIENALDVVRGPMVASEAMCGMHGQAYVAPTAMAPRGPDEFVKIRCMPSTAVGNALQKRASIQPLGPQNVAGE